MKEMKYWCASIVSGMMRVFDVYRGHNFDLAYESQQTVIYFVTMLILSLLIRKQSNLFFNEKDKAVC